MAVALEAGKDQQKNQKRLLFFVDIVIRARFLYCILLVLKRVCNLNLRKSLEIFPASSFLLVHDLRVQVSTTTLIKVRVIYSSRLIPTQYQNTSETNIRLEVELPLF